MHLMEQLLELAFMPESDLSAQGLTRARLSLLDWMACGLAGSAEVLSE